MANLKDVFNCSPVLFLYEVSYHPLLFQLFYDGVFCFFSLYSVSSVLTCHFLFLHLPHKCPLGTCPFFNFLCHPCHRLDSTASTRNHQRSCMSAREIAPEPECLLDLFLRQSKCNCSLMSPNIHPLPPFLSLIFINGLKYYLAAQCT